MNRDPGELKQLFEELRIEPAEAASLQRDLQQDESWLASQREPEIPAGLIERLDRNLVQSRQPRRRYPYWLTRVAAVVALAFISLALFQVIREPISDDPVNEFVQEGIPALVLENEQVVWEVALTLEDDVDQESSDAVLSEVIDLWEEAGWDMDNLLSQETTDEKDNLGNDVSIDHNVA